MRCRARKSAERFTDRGFADKWLANMDKLVALQVERTKKGSDAAKMDAEVHKMPKGTTGDQLNEE